MKSNPRKETTVSAFRFGRFELDVAETRLFCDGLEKVLQPQPFKVLLYFLDRPGKLVTRDELKNHVWGDTVVEYETGLNFCISRLRESLGDDGANQQYIKTVPRRGYRFVAPVARVGKARVASGRRGTPKRRLALVAGLTVAIMSMLVIYRIFTAGGEGALEFRVAPVAFDGRPLGASLTPNLTDALTGRLTRNTTNRGVPVKILASDELSSGRTYELKTQVWLHRSDVSPVRLGYRFSITGPSDSVAGYGSAGVLDETDISSIQSRLGEAASRYVESFARAEQMPRGMLTRKPMAVFASDVGNYGSSSDIQVQCRLGPAGVVARFSVLLAPPQIAHLIDIDRLAELPGDRIIPMPAGWGCEPSLLPSGGLDVAGDPVSDGSELSLLVLAISDGDTALSNPSPPFRIRPGLGVRTLVPSISASGGLFLDDEFLYAGDWGPTPNTPSMGGLYRIDRNTAEVTTVTTELAGFYAGVSIESGIFLTNFGTGSLIRVTPGGTTAVVADGLLGPTGLVPRGEGEFLVAECNGASIALVTLGGEKSRFVVSPLLNCPTSMTMDEVGNLFVCSRNSGEVVVVFPNRAVEAFAPIPGGKCGHVTYHDGSLYVTAQRANQVYRIGRDRSVSLLAGSGERNQFDGPVLEASFSRPNGLAVTPDGLTLYVTDRRAIAGEIATPNSIRVVDLAGFDHR